MTRALLLALGKAEFKMHHFSSENIFDNVKKAVLGHLAEKSEASTSLLPLKNNRMRKKNFLHDKDIQDTSTGNQVRRAQGQRQVYFIIRIPFPI